MSQSHSMSHPIIVPAGSKYILPSDEPEGERLGKQHKFIVNSVYGGRLIYDKTVIISPGDRVLDAGAGSGAWSIDFSKEVADTVKIDGIDISPNMFPKSPPANVNFSQGSLTALPQDWTGSFKFVHQRLLIGGLRAVEWPIVASEYYRILRPGGSVQFWELDCPGWTKTPTEQRIVEIWQQLFQKRGLLLDCGMRLPRILQQAGFIDIHLEVKQVAVGKQGGQYGSLGTDALGSGLRKIGLSVEEEGNIVSSKTEYNDVMDKMVSEWDEEKGGRKLSVVIVYAKKPNGN